MFLLHQQKRVRDILFPPLALLQYIPRRALLDEVGYLPLGNPEHDHACRHVERFHESAYAPFFLGLIVTPFLSVRNSFLRAEPSALAVSLVSSRCC